MENKLITLLKIIAYILLILNILLIFYLVLHQKQLMANSDCQLISHGINITKCGCCEILKTYKSVYH